MIPNSIKAKIRLERVQRKLDKRVYPTCLVTKAIVKLNEKYKQLSKDIEKTYSTMYSKGFRPDKDNQNPEYFEDFDFILRCERKMERISKQVAKLCIKVGKTEDQITEAIYYLNVGRGSTSH